MLTHNWSYVFLQRQLCSDVDYVIFPVRDPAISRQEYADHKLLTRLLPPPYCSSKSSLLYRSAPNVQALGATVRPPSVQFAAGAQSSNLAALRCFSTHSLTRANFENAPPPARAASDDNLLSPQPPPRPPPRPPPMVPRVSVPARPPRFPSTHQIPVSHLSTISFKFGWYYDGFCFLKCLLLLFKITLNRQLC